MPLRVGVVGVGVMGRNHARILDGLDDVSFVAAADPSPAVEEYIRRRTHARWYADHRAMIASERLDAVVVAVPTVLHHRIASDAIGAGLHVLIEKPIGATVAEAEELIARASAARVQLSVGHIERFNPAIVALKARLDAGALGGVFQVQTRRQSPMPLRVADVGVTIDLATHDIDLLRHLLSSEPVHTFARTARRLHAGQEDLLVAVLSFPGVIATLEVNWLTPMKIRELTVIGERGMFVVHHLTQDLTFFANHAPLSGEEDWAELATLVGASEGDVTRFSILHEEPLLLELRNFTRACLGAEQLGVTAHDGLRALQIAEQLSSSASRWSSER